MATVVEVATGEVATGEVATGEVATGEVAEVDFVEAIVVATGEVATGEVAIGRGGDRRGGDRRGRDDRPRYEPLKGVKTKFEPTEAAVKGLSKHIRETLRAFPIADLAKMILKGRDRYQVRFEADENGPQLFQCKDDGSVWLTREEAISHLLAEGALEKFYDVDEVDIGAPSGNFAQIAVCGMSGTLLGPPNHHEYQRNVMRLHAEKFSNMSLERFKSCIEMQSDEEVIEKWKESVSKQKQYRLKSDKPAEEEKVETVSAEEPVAEEAAPSEEETVERDEVADEAETEEVSAENEESIQAETSEEEAADESELQIPRMVPARRRLPMRHQLRRVRPWKRSRRLKTFSY